MKFPALIFLFFFLVPVLSQNNREQPGHKQWYKTAVAYYNLENPTAETDSLAILYFQKTINAVQNQKRYEQLLIDCLIKTGNIYQGQHKYLQAIPHYRTSLLKSVQQKDTSLLYQSNLYMGSAKYYLNEVDSATFYLERASALVHGRKDLPDLTVLYNSLGVIYYEGANYKQAINYFQIALDDLQKEDETYAELYVGFKNNIAGCYSRLGEYRRALNEYQSLLPYRQLRNSVMQNIGHTYYLLQQYDSAMTALKQVSFSPSAHYVKALNEMARVYMQKGMLEQSEKYFDSAIHLNKQLPGHIKNQTKATSYLYRSQLAQKQGLTDEALSWCNIALQELHFNFTWKKAEDLPANETDVISPIIFFDVLQQKAALFMEKYDGTCNQKFLVHALETWILAIKSSNYIRASFDNDEAALLFSENFSQRFKIAARLATRLYNETGDKKYAEHFLFITESYKGSVLYNNIKSAEVKSKGILPDSLLKKERELKQMLAVFTNRINNIESEAVASIIQKKITALQYDLSRMQKNFERFPGYSKMEKPGNRLTTAELKSNLGRNTSAIKYIWADSSLLCYASNEHEFILKEFQLTPAVKKSFSTYISSLYNAQEGLRFTGYDAAKQLYDFLIRQLPSSITENPRWVIIPDGAINYLPFETLLTGKDSRTYLAQSKTISYHYSFSLLLNHEPAMAKNNTIFAAAPFSTSSITMSDAEMFALPFSKNEIEKLPGIKAEHDKATKQSFIDLSKKSNIIHLATHAFAGKNLQQKNQTFIQFYHNPQMAPEYSRLYLHELYNLQFTGNPLVILSACETAAGEENAGEGLMSLSRGFLYAGSRGIISTLWKAEDRVTAYIMKRLHFYLQKGLPAEQALKKARIDFLNDEQMDVRLKSPNYWGHIIYTGAVSETNMTTGKNKTFTWLIAVGAAVALLFAFIWFRKTKKFR